MKTTILVVLPILFLNLAHAKTVKISDNLVLDNGDTQWTSYFKKRPFDVFLGIPYAQPPIGNLRFALPQKYSKNDKKIYVGENPEQNPHVASTCTQMNFFEVLEPILTKVYNMEPEALPFRYPVDPNQEWAKGELQSCLLFGRIFILDWHNVMLVS